MAKRPFSKKYKTFEEWLANFKGSESYRNRIISAHAKYPDATLSQLRGHARKKEKKVSELKETPIYKLPWDLLSRKDRIQRQKALAVLSEVRKGKSLTKACKQLHTTPKSVIKHTNAFKKVKGKWIPKAYDKISRVMRINENGKEVDVEINDSRIASEIGKYQSAVREFLRTGNVNVLLPFNKPFKDAKGNIHYFELDPDKLYEIAESREEPEFWEIYKI